MFGLRKAILAAGLVLTSASTLHAQEVPADRCTAGSPRREGKVDKLTIVVENSTPPGECRLSVSRGHKELFAAQAKILDVLAMGEDLNLDGKPDLAFQTGPAGECCWTLQLLSLDKSPRPVGEIRNRLPFVLQHGDSTSAPVFWAKDGAFAGGFDGLREDELTNLPRLRITWDGGKPFLVGYDNSARVQPGAKDEPSPSAERVAAFRQSDGRLESTAPEIQPLRKTKADVLGIVLRHLYAEDDDLAWSKLEEFWPESDFPRIRKLLAETVQSGLQSRLFRVPSFTNANCPVRPGPFPRVDKDLVPPHGVYTPNPPYSTPARDRKYQGTVVLWVVISPEGCVSRVRVQRFLGLGLDEQAIEAVGRWKFEPARKNGVPVAVQVNVEVNFRLY